jgi:hypothetical protein
VRRSFVAGEPVTLALPGWNPGDPVAVTAPDGTTLKPAVAALPGTALLRLDEAAVPGVWTVEYAGKSFSFVVNAGREDALLTPASATELLAWWRPLDAEVAPADEMARSFTTGGGQALVPWLVGTAVLLLLLETFLVHYLCPRVNPTAATVIVHRRGLLRRTAASEPSS